MAVNPLLVGGGIVTTAAVVGGGLYAGGVFSSSKTPEHTGGGSGKDVQRLKLVSLKDANEYLDTANKTKFGGKFAYYFLSHSQKDANTQTWKDRLTALKSDQTSTLQMTELQTVKSEASPTEEKLREGCKKVYDKAEGDYANVITEEKWNEAWKYCSIGGNRPTTISGASSSLTGVSGADEEKGFGTASGGNKFGETLKASAISTFDKNNQWFWDLRQEEFKAGVLDDGASSTATAYFNKDNTEKKTIQVLCREAYKKTAPNTGGPTEADVKKYCTLTGK